MTTVDALADEMLEVIADEDPLNDALEGYPGVAHRLPEVDEAAQAGLRERALGIAKAVRDIGPRPPDWVTAALIVQQAEAVAARMDARLVEHTMVSYDVAPIGRLLGAMLYVRTDGPEREQAFLARLAAMPRYLAQAADRHRAGVAAGRLPVAERVNAAIARLDDYLSDWDGNPLRATTLSPAGAAQRDRLLTEVVRPAFATYRDVLATEIASHGRPPERPGLCWLPGGEAVYATLARVHTTTDSSPESLHQTGLGLIRRLGEEYVALGSGLFGADTITAAEVLRRMRTDPALRWTSAADLMDTARAAIERAERAAPDWFSRQPTERCVLEPVPDSDAPVAPMAYYVPAAVDGSRPGTYFANTYRVTERDSYTCEATTFHEAVPGHHIQFSIAQQLTGHPWLRRLAWINSYIEGWGLYAERLADEMGLYSSDTARLGMLAMDSMRAARLVVDTGLHALGWSRRQAVDYLRANTAMTELAIQAETDRYIEMPGQALSYMVGRLELLRLRARAQHELGAAFDIRAFHDLVLGTGPLPMAVLDEVVAEWTTRPGR